MKYVYRAERFGHENYCKENSAGSQMIYLRKIQKY